MYFYKKRAEKQMNAFFESILKEDKTRFINALPWIDEEDKKNALNFFKSHANLESKINWQNKDKEATMKDIRALMQQTSENKDASIKKRSVFKEFPDFEKHDCRIIGEDYTFLYVNPLSWEGAKYCDSTTCGGEGAKWCIGYERDNTYWKSYVFDKRSSFVMAFRKNRLDKPNKLKYMIQIKYDPDKDRDIFTVWNQEDKDQDIESFGLKIPEEIIEKTKEFFENLRNSHVNGNDFKGIVNAISEKFPEIQVPEKLTIKNISYYMQDCFIAMLETLQPVGPAGLFIELGMEDTGITFYKYDRTFRMLKPTLEFKRYLLQEDKDSGDIYDSAKVAFNKFYETTVLEDIGFFTNTIKNFLYQFFKKFAYFLSEESNVYALAIGQTWKDNIFYEDIFSPRVFEKYELDVDFVKYHDLSISPSIIPIRKDSKEFLNLDNALKNELIRNNKKLNENYNELLNRFLEIYKS